MESGYEAVSNREVHMKQIGMEKIWLRFIKQYVQPLQERVFEGFQGNNVNYACNCYFVL